MKKVICLFGPTGSGKTDISIKIAEKFNLSVISADSMQVYREMNIGTNKISEKEKQNIRHYLIDIRNPDEYYSTNDFFKDCLSIIEHFHKDNKPAFIVGGTGLYFKSIFYGMFETPKKDEQLREKLSLEYDRDPCALYEKLKEIDLSYANIVHVNDKRRIIRALEIYYASNKIISKMDNQTPDLDFLKIGIMPDRDILYEKINSRCDFMIKEGLIEETENLIKKYGLKQQSFQAIGYSHVIRYLNNEFNKDELIRLFKRDTRHFAKRQFTLFKTFSNVNWQYKIDVQKIEEIIYKYLDY